MDRLKGEKMGKVLKLFGNGYPGAVSRSIDHIIISLRNASGGEIPFGAPVFLVSGEKACTVFDPSSSAAGNFLGFAVRAADKTPDVYGSSQASFAPNDPVDILVRGSVVLKFTGAVPPNAGVYIRKSDGAVMAVAGEEGTSLQLPNVTVRTPRDSGACAEVVLTKRNLL